MANDEHVRLLKRGVAAWNAWRAENRNIRPDLSKADLKEAYLPVANISGASLIGADLFQADLFQADLSNANLSGVRLVKVDLIGANISGASLIGADLFQADLSNANLSGATLRDARLVDADLFGADLSGADLREANLCVTNLNKANLSGANLATALLLDTDLKGADLTGCCVYGISAWGLKLKGAKQQNMVITSRAKENEPTVTVDNIEVAQFVYLLLNNQKIRDVIDTITSKAVLILGRFTAERKAVLDALREELRKRDYLPILFDFELPARQNITETVTLLARMARFIIADLTDPSSIPQELQAIIPSVRVPVQPLLLEGSSLYSMFKDFDPQDFHWVLPVYRYKNPEQLLETLAAKVIAPAEEKVRALQERRRMIEAELTKPR